MLHKSWGKQSYPFEKTSKIFPIKPPESSPFDVFVKVGIGGIAVRNSHSSWLRKFSMYSQSLSYMIFSNFFDTRGRMLTVYNLLHYYDLIFQKL